MCRARCVLAPAPHSAAQYREACTCRPVLALHPRRPIKCLHHDSDTARMLSRCVLARAPHSAPPRRRRLHVQASTGLAPTPPDKMHASRFRYIPNARPRPCVAVRASTCTPHRTAAQYRETCTINDGIHSMIAYHTLNDTGRCWPCKRRCCCHSRNGGTVYRRRMSRTGLAPTPPDKMPASRFRYSPNALAMRASTCTPQRTATHKTPARTGQYRPVLAFAPTPPDKMPASRFRYSPNASPRPCRDAC
jgi:hypothetical protein